MEDGGWKRIALDGKKERFVQKRAFCLRKRAVFSAHVKPTDKEKLFSAQENPIYRCTKANEQLQILSVKNYCELAVHLSFFEKYQSCVCTTIILSHRFKAFSPPFCAKKRFRHEPTEILSKKSSAEL